MVACKVKVNGSLDSFPCSVNLVPWFNSLEKLAPDAWIHFLVPWTWFHGCLEKVPGCLDPLPCSLGLVPWSAGECFWLLTFGSWFPGLGSMVPG